MTLFAIFITTLLLSISKSPEKKKLPGYPLSIAPVLLAYEQSPMSKVQCETIKGVRLTICRIASPATLKRGVQGSKFHIPGQQKF
jgi:hypothetical protein